MEDPGSEPGAAGGADEDAVVFDFLSELLDDEAGGGVRPLREYLARYAGHEEAVAAEYLRATGRAEVAQPAVAAEKGARGSVAPPGAGPGEGGPGDGRVIGHYRLDRELGAGGQGAVWLARDEDLGRRVALKLMTTPFITEERRRRFRREAESIARLDHPGLAGVHDADVDAEPPWIAMRYVEGTDLSRGIEAAREALAGSGRRQLDPEDLPLIPGSRAELARVLRFFERAARALHAAHDEGLVHRDIKPANLMVSPSGDPVVLDFGLARMAEAEGETPDPALTREGEVFGTPAYMAPEQLSSGAAESDGRADVWALGVSLHEALTGERPFRGEGQHGLAVAILNAPIPDPIARNPVVTTEVRVILATAMERDLARRYPSALAFAEDLRRIREFEPIQARPAGRWLRLRRWCRREPASAVTVAALAIGFALTAVGLKVNGDLLETSNENLSLAESRLDLATARNFRNRVVEFEARSPAGALALALEATQLVDTWWTRAALVGPLQRVSLERIFEVPAGRAWGAAAFGGGRRVVAGSSEGFVSVFDLDQGELLSRRQLSKGDGEPGDVRRIVLSRGGGEVLTISTDGWLRSLELPGLATVFERDLGLGPLIWMDGMEEGGGALVLSRAGTVARIRTDDGTIQTRFEIPERSATEVLWVPGTDAPSFPGGLILTGPRLKSGEALVRSKEVRVWSPEGEPVGTVAVDGYIRLFTWFDGGVLVADQGGGLRHVRLGAEGALGARDCARDGDRPVECLVRSVSGEVIVGQGAGGNSRVLAPSRAPVLLADEVRFRGVVAASWREGGALVIAGGDGTLRELERDGGGWKSVRAHGQESLEYGLLPLAGGRLLSYGGRARLSLWRPIGVPGCWRLPVVEGAGPARSVLAIEGAEETHGDLVVTAHEGGQVRGLVLSTSAPSAGCGRLIETHGGRDAPPPLLAGAAAVGRFASAGDDSRVILHDVSGASVGPECAAEGARALALCVSASGTVAAAAFSGGLVRVVVEGAEAPLEVALEGACAVAADPAGAWVAAGDERGDVWVYDLVDGELRLRWTATPKSAGRLPGRRSAAVTSLDVTADGARLLSSSRERWVDEWTVADGLPAAAGLQVMGHRWSRYLGDGARMVAVGRSWSTIRVDATPAFAAEGAGRIFPERRHRDEHTAVTVAPGESPLVLTASGDGTVLVWDAAGGALVTRYTEHEGAVTDVHAGLPGHAVSVSEDGTVAMWPLRGVELARRHRPRGLYPEEQQRLELDAGER
jgi:serine/threonine protein kinase/WD40 repeat protein